jgi:hypothetical protein
VVPMVDRQTKTRLCSSSSNHVPTEIAARQRNMVTLLVIIKTYISSVVKTDSYGQNLLAIVFYKSLVKPSKY